MPIRLRDGSAVSMADLEQMRAKSRAPIEARYSFVRWCSPVVDAVEKLRTRFIRERDEMIALQKAAQKNSDRDGARFFREEVSDRLRYYRACCIVLPWVSASYPGDCKFVEPKDVPLELGSAVDLIWQWAAD